MLTSKQRANLRSMAQKIQPVTQVGKGGITDGLLESLDSAIEKRQLIKVTVLENSGMEVKEVGEKIATALRAEFVCATGRKIVFYRESADEKVEKLIF